MLSLNSHFLRDRCEIHYVIPFTSEILVRNMTVKMGFQIDYLNSY